MDEPKLVGNHDFDMAGRDEMARARAATAAVQPHRPGLGSDDVDPAEKARETEKWRAGVVRSTYARPQTSAEIRERLGPEARVVSEFGRTRPGGWEQLTADARLADVSARRTDAYGDPDTAESENRYLGRAISVAKHQSSRKEPT
jgi:hypothetical protein